ncbi:MAG: alpha/beta fold hydrolase [Nitriliruptorales bacterium]|nr:alpha/beta fold hydrolase [Nitriliruptorales bacterium]
MCAALAGVGWYYAGEILNVEVPSEPEYDTRVVAVGDGRVTLQDTADTRSPGTVGLDAPDAYAQAGKILAADDDGVTRRLNVLDGELKQGDLVDVDGYAFPQDPDAAFEFPVTEVRVPAPLGEQPAWLADAPGRRWAVLVHGRAARRNECFRMVPILHQLDVTSLCISYRNDRGGPVDPDRIYRQGATEWEDVEAGVRYALDHGANDVVLVGYSMGGQITANFLRRSDLAAEVSGVIWDGPALDWGPAIAAGADDRGVPGWLVPIGMQGSEWRAGIDYDDLNQVTHADAFKHPILLFHGDADASVPVSVADRFAAARPDLVTYVRVRGAGHVRAWNANPSRYRRAVRRFIAGLD